jgi:hypothetical protein
VLADYHRAEPRRRWLLALVAATSSSPLGASQPPSKPMNQPLSSNISASIANRE